MVILFIDPSQCDNNATAPCPCRDDLCGDTWNEALEGITYQWTMDNNYQNYRYYHSDPCKGFRIKYESTGDNGFISVTFLETGAAASRWINGVNKRQYRYLCPTDLYWSAGTYNIQFCTYFFSS